MSDYHRRGVLAGLVGLTGAVVSGCATPLSASGGGRLSRIGLQLYTLRNIFEPDPVGTLRMVAKIGYKEVEFGGGNYDKMDHAFLRRTLDDEGLSAPSLHVGYNAVRDEPQRVIDMAKTLGATYVVVPSLPKELHSSKDGWLVAVQTFNRAAETFKAAGLGFLYHNHSFEFVDLGGGETGYDILVREGHPDLVKLELDLYWAVAAGKDPRALMAASPGRIKALHVKDRAVDGAMDNVGDGTIDFAAIFSDAKTAGVEHYFVEHDALKTEDYEIGITKSLTYLKALRFG